MKILAVDPGTSHIVYTVTEWEGERCLGIPSFGWFKLPSAPDWPGTQDKARGIIHEIARHEFPAYDEAVVEMQNYRPKSGSKADHILSVALVAGALLLKLGPGAIPAPTDNAKPRRAYGVWSAMRKEMRHERLIGRQLDYLDLSPQTFNNPSKRVYGDYLDTVAMGLWRALGCPRNGI